MAALDQLGIGKDVPPVGNRFRGDSFRTQAIGKQVLHHPATPVVVVGVVALSVGFAVVRSRQRARRRWSLFG